MRYAAFQLALILFCGLGHAQTLTQLTCEQRQNPMGLNTRQPRLSWKIASPERNFRQSAYQVQVAAQNDFSDKNLVWNPGKVASGESVLQEYAGKPLESGKRYFWKVKIWDASGKESAWSETASWQTGYQPADWQAKWMEADKQPDPKKVQPGFLFRKEFAVKGNIASAVVYVTSYGLYKLHLNGQKVGNEELTPGWTSYNKRLQYQMYDVTNQLKAGKNALGAMLGEGWYKTVLGWSDNRNFYGERTALLCQLSITYADGSRQTVVSDGTWKSTTEGAVRSSEIYNGEVYDARMEQKGWDMVGFNDKNWRKTIVAKRPFANLIASEGVPVRKIQEIKPIRIFKTPQGTLVADMGQNMVGWIRLKVSGAAGTKITLRHTEVLDKAGNFYTANLRGAKQRIEYTLKGGGEEVYEPYFTFMGFRFVAIEGFPGQPTPDNLTGVVVHSDMPPTGIFTCSDSLVNQLQHNIQWGQKGNFVDVPTDCPQRDERLGWTGDAQAFSRTAAFNMDVAAFFTKWMKDLTADQLRDGAVPFVIPDVLNKYSDSLVGAWKTSAGWGDVALITPVTMYQVYGDKRMLETQYPSMKAYVDYIRKAAGPSNIWKNGSVFGDWLFYHPPINSHAEPDGYTNNDYIATAFYAHSARLLHETARTLGKKEDEVFYGNLFESIKKTFIQEYVTAAGRVASDSQTAYVLALMFDLLPADTRPRAAQHLANDIKSRKNHLSTGFLGTPYLCHVLSENGFTDVAYDLLLQQTYPSWLYPVKMGATTIWERWDAQKPDSTFQDEGMNSFNHYAYGAVGDWMYRVVAGLEIGKPGYKHILIQPQLPAKGRLTHAKAVFQSAYGEIVSGWERNAGQLKFSVTIPPNTTATIRLPKIESGSVRESGKPLNLSSVKTDNGDTVIETGSGQYVFEYAEK